MTTSAANHTNLEYGLAVTALEHRFGDRLSTSLAQREHHGNDMTKMHPNLLPDAVLFAQSTDEVAEAVKICHKHKTPIIPFGAGTSLEGQIAAPRGGVCIDLSQMNALIRLSQDDQDCTVQAGLTRRDLNSLLRDTGLFFPIDACPDASIGGMASTRASGTNAIRYGTMRENVLSLTVVLADGRIIKTANRARKSAAGYDLTRLFVGAAGTLGIITEVTIRLYGIPEHVSAAICAFPSVEAAVLTVTSIVQAGIPMAKIEILDEVQIGACNKYSNLNLTVAPYLFFEFDGTPQAIKEYTEIVGDIAREHGGVDFQWATSRDERTRIWEARHSAGSAAMALRPGSLGWASDVTVPISRLPECIRETKRDLMKLPMPAPICGHVGDGNFHIVIPVDPNSPAELELVMDVNRRLIARTLAMDGTCTGEHGIGIGKSEWMEPEFGPEAIAVMQSLKHALDPHDLMNPGKIFWRTNSH